MTNKLETIQVPRRLLDVLRFWLERANERSESGDIAELVELRALLAAPSESTICGACIAGTTDPEHLDADGKCRYLNLHQEPPLIQTLHANGDRIAMEATIAQQAQRIADLVRGRGEPVAWIDPASLNFSENEKQWVRIAGSLAENRMNGYTMPLYAEQPEPVAVLASLWEIRVRDEPDNPESPCEYVYVSSVAERDSILRRGGASVFAEYACLNKVKELNQ